jgi:excisionase family DNA binding protein
MRSLSSTLPETENGEVYLTVEEATEYLGVSRDTLERYARAGPLTKYRRGVTRRIYYKQSELDQLNRFRPIDQDQDS